MNDIDWAAVLRHITASNVAKWITVIAFAVVAVTSVLWFVVYAWKHS